ncbi:MAG: hypothetical protein Q4Q31_03075 [Bacillota bacterium]|nr:hypothetical protein [Bacillota bacterium]
MGMGNTPMAGATVAIAVAIEEACKYLMHISFTITLKLMNFQCNCKTPVISILDENNAD